MARLWANIFLTRLLWTGNKINNIYTSVLSDNNLIILFFRKYNLTTYRVARCLTPLSGDTKKFEFVLDELRDSETYQLDKLVVHVKVKMQRKDGTAVALNSQTAPIDNIGIYCFYCVFKTIQIKFNFVSYRSLAF
jgi:hypothetical protein